MTYFSAKAPFDTRAATLIAAVLLGLSGSRSVSVWLQVNNELPQDKANNISQHSTKTTNKKVDYGRLAKLHLLGIVEKEAKPTPQKQEMINAPETNLNLKLIGVLFNSNNDDGFAIISESGKSQKTFHKGDKVSDNATLYSVEPNRVILIRNGRHETLTLIKPDIHAKAPPSSNRVSPKTTRRPLRRPRNNENKILHRDPSRAFPKKAGPT